MNLPVQIRSYVLILEISEEMMFTQFTDLLLSYTLSNHRPCNYIIIQSCKQTCAVLEKDYNPISLW